MQNQLSSGDSSFDILKKPDHILSFIKHALQTATQIPITPAESKRQKTAGGLRIEDLRIVEEKDEEDELVEGDSDDEDEPTAPKEGSDEDMTSTALNLLLAILEGKPCIQYTI